MYIFIVSIHFSLAKLLVCNLVFILLPLKVFPLLCFFLFYRDLGLHALQNVGLFDPNALIHHNHEDICKNSLHLSNEQRRMCARSPRVFAVSFYFFPNNENKYINTSRKTNLSKLFQFNCSFLLEMKYETLLQAIVSGAKMGQEECQHQFRNSRWNCTTSKPSTDLQDIYGDVLRISKSCIE